MASSNDAPAAGSPHLRPRAGARQAVHPADWLFGAANTWPPSQVCIAQIIRRRARLTAVVVGAAFLFGVFNMGRRHEASRQDTAAPPPGRAQREVAVRPGRALHGIPKIIHQTWKTHDIPGDCIGAVESWRVMNPGYEYRLYDDAEIDAHMRKMHPELMVHWKRMKPIEKADMFRYAILYDEGGIYADIDVTCNRPVDDWLKQTGDFYNVDLIVGFEICTKREDWRKWFARQFQVSQWTMAGHKGHPVFKSIMDKVAHFFATHTDKERKSTSVVQTTGPGPWSDAVLEHLEAEYGVKYGDGYFTHDRASEKFLHIGTVLMMPIRAFSLGSAGYQLKAHHSMDDVFIRHGFKGARQSGNINSGCG